MKFEENSKKIAKLMAVIEDICIDEGCSTDNAELIILAQTNGDPDQILDFIDEHQAEIDELYYDKYAHGNIDPVSDEDEDEDYDDEGEAAYDDEDDELDEEYPADTKEACTEHDAAIFISKGMLDKFGDDCFTVTKDKAHSRIELIPGDCVAIKKKKCPSARLVYRHPERGTLVVTGKPVFNEYEPIRIKSYPGFGLIEITKRK